MFIEEAMMNLGPAGARMVKLRVCISYVGVGEVVNYWGDLRGYQFSVIISNNFKLICIE